MKLKALDIPTAKVNQFKRKEIETIDDLVRYVPKKYYDFRNPVSINKLKEGSVVAVVGTIKGVNIYNKGFVQVKVSDGTGTMFIGFFNQTYLIRKLKSGDEMIFCGKIQFDDNYPLPKMINPSYFGKDIEKYQRIMPVYGKISNMAESYLLKTMKTALELVDRRDSLEDEIKDKFKVVNKATAIKEVHNPSSGKALKQARKRLLFDDLFHFAMQLELSSQNGNKESSFIMKDLNKAREFIEKLPFELTEGQNNALKKIYLQMNQGIRVNSLLQGDVGCGKTIVAIILMMIASENGYQSAIMAPTGVLAKQHYEELVERLPNETVVYLSGDMKVKERREALGSIKTGEAKFIVGTHAVISKDVMFNNLALTIVDEEHRFGVEQRETLREKAKLGVHHVNMSATPIPRSLALAVYGDGVNVLTIKTMPKGRKKIKTVRRDDEIRVYEGLYSEVKRGHQGYVICPLVEDSDFEGLEGIDSVETTYKKMIHYFKKYPKVKIGMISGKMKRKEIEETIRAFEENEIQILISTTIVEVGVNVPNATSIVIKDADRFGLAQLHQLRGRVGRGDKQSYCVLLSKKPQNQKLLVMEETTDGFKVAEADMKLRGAGDFVGSKQTGQNKYVLLMLRYFKWYEMIRDEVKLIFKDKQRLGHYGKIVKL